MYEQSKGILFTSTDVYGLEMAKLEGLQGLFKLYVVVLFIYLFFIFYNQCYHLIQHTNVMHSLRNTKRKLKKIGRKKNQKNIMLWQDRI